MKSIIIPLFCVYDEKAEMYLPPFTAMNRAVAHRIFESAVMQEGHDFNRHADDYSLWEIGKFDQDKGLVTSDGKHHNVVNAHHLMAKFNNSIHEVKTSG